MKMQSTSIHLKYSIEYALQLTLTKPEIKQLEIFLTFVICTDILLVL